MRGRQLAIYLSIFIIVVSFYLIYDVAFRKKKAAFEEVQTKIFNLDRQKVTALKIRNKDVEIHLVRRGENDWRITRPVRTEALADQVQNLIDRALEGKKEKAFSGSDIDLAEFGLGIPEISLTLMTGAKIAAPTLDIGGKNSLGDTYYARLSDAREVFTISAGLFQALNRSLYDLRNKDLIAAPMNEIDGLTGLAPRKVELSRTDSGAWEIVGSDRELADKEIVDRILFQGVKGRIQSFLTPEGEEADQCFNSPVLKLRVNAKGSVLGEITVAKPAEPADRKTDRKNEQAEQYWARTTLRPEILVLDNETVEALIMIFGDLRDKHVVRFDRQAVDSIEVARGERAVRAERVEEGWKVTEPKDAKTGNHHIVAFLIDLENLRYTRSLEATPASVQENALDRPDLRVRLLGKEKPLAELSFRLDPTDDNLLAARAGSGPIVFIDDAFLDKLLPDLKKEPSGTD